MIEAKELRIGNIASWGLGSIILDIDNFNEEDLDYCSPIPLTEEWLVKFGFDDNFHKGKFWVCLDDDGYFYTNHNLNDEGFTEVLHVHQLQNLYFALTGEELTIKEDIKQI